MRIFLYGTLTDAEVRAAVLGRFGDGLRLEPARAPGYEAVWGKGRDWPFLVRRPGALAAGLLAGPVPPPALARLRDYEGREYRLGRILVVPGRGPRRTAAAFLARPGARLSARRFDPETWRTGAKGRVLAALRA